MCSSNTPKLDELALPEFHVTGNGGNCAIWKKKRYIPDSSTLLN